MQNYYPIEPIKAYVKSSQILHQGSYEKEIIECEIIAVCLYVNEAITFMIKLDDGEIFRYIPSHVLYWTDIIIGELSFEEVNYHNSLDDDVKISVIDTLKGDASAYIHQKDQWMPCSYILSIDFYKEDRMINLVKLYTGQFAWLPFHKLKFKACNEIQTNFKNFKAQRQKWIVGGEK